MCVTVNWDDPAHRIMRYEFAEGWQFADYYRAGGQALKMIAQEPHSVDLIFHLLHPQFPPGVFKEGQNLVRYIPNNTVTIAIVGASDLYRFLGHMMGYLFPNYAGIYVYTKTLNEARQLIIQRREIHS